MNSVNQKERVRLDEIGLYLRTIQLDYNPKDDQEMSELITQHFNVLCLVEDIEYYERMTAEWNTLSEDYELSSRREEYFNKLNIRNPFY